MRHSHFTHAAFAFTTLLLACGCSNTSGSSVPATTETTAAPQPYATALISSPAPTASPSGSGLVGASGSGGPILQTSVFVPRPTSGSPNFTEAYTAAVPFTGGANWPDPPNILTYVMLTNSSAPIAFAYAFGYHFQMKWLEPSAVYCVATTLPGATGWTVDTTAGTVNANQLTVDFSAYKASYTFSTVGQTYAMVFYTLPPGDTCNEQ